MNAKRIPQLGLALAATLGLGATFSSGIAQAQPRHHDHDRYRDHDRNRVDNSSAEQLRLYDRDRNGRLDPSERDVMDNDTNRDGRLSRRERASIELHFWNLGDDDVFYDHHGRDEISFRFSSSARKFARFDVNRDGGLTWREVRGSSLARHFRDVDRDGDRMISPRELDRFHRRMGKRIQARYNPGVLRGDGYRYEYRLSVGV